MSEPWPNPCLGIYKEEIHEGILRRMQWGREGVRVPGKSQVAIGFFRNSGTHPLPEKQLGPSGPITSRRRFVWPSVKYAGD